GQGRGQGRLPRLEGARQDGGEGQGRPEAPDRRAAAGGGGQLRHGGGVLHPAARHPPEGRRQDGGPGDLLPVPLGAGVRGRQGREGVPDQRRPAGGVRRGAQGRGRQAPQTGEEGVRRTCASASSPTPTTGWPGRAAPWRSCAPKGPTSWPTAAT